jgi:PEGA domain
MRSPSRIFVVALAVMALLLNCSCATIFHGKSQTINIGSDPPGARVEAGGNTFITPAQVTLARDTDYSIVAQKSGYQDASATITHSVDWYTFLGNIIFGGLIGWAIDFSSGSAYELSPETVNIPMLPAGQEKAVPAGQPAPPAASSPTTPE